MCAMYFVRFVIEGSMQREPGDELSPGYLIRILT